VTRPLTAADLWDLPRVGAPEPISASEAIVPVTRFDADHDDGLTRLWRVRRDGEPVPLTRPERSATAPAVSPDGSRLAFLEKHEGTAQVRVMRLDGGEAEPVGDFPLGVRGVRWIPDGSGLVVAAPLYREAPTLEASRRVHEERAGHRVPFVTEQRVYRFWDRWLDRLDHLFRLDLDGSTLHLTEGVDRAIALDDPGNSFDVSPDGTTVAFTMDVHEPAWERFEFTIHLVPTTGGTITRLDLPPVAHRRRPRWAHDGAALVYGLQREWDFYADRVRLARLDLASGTETVLTEEWDRSCGGWELDDDRIVFSAEDRGRVRLFTVPFDAGPGATPADLPTGGGSAHGPHPAGAVIWHRVESMRLPPQVAVTGGDGTEIVTRFGADLLDEVDLGRIEETTIAGADGDPVQVFLVFPPGHEPGSDRRLPLIHNIHGGPHGVVLDAWHWRWNTQVFAGTGALVACVNFHGSSSWGQDFAQGIHGAWGEAPAADVLAATDHLVDLGLVDEERMAIAGGSYGGYLVTWLTTRTDRFAAAVCHAGVTDLLGQWASDVTAGRERSIGGVPWDDLDAVLRWSPAAHTADVATPTLVVHGAKDQRVVPTQGLLWYGLLQAKGVPSRLVWFPEEGHWVEKRRDGLLWWDEVLGWIARWTG